MEYIAIGCLSGSLVCFLIGILPIGYKKVGGISFYKVAGYQLSVCKLKSHKR